jgi:hydrogenase maturation protease
LSQAPILIFAWGNPSRGDDALGPELLARIGERPGVELLTDFQLQPEFVTDLQDRELVLFADASVSCAPPFSFGRVVATRDQSFTSHAMSPSALLAAFHDVYGAGPPPCFLLAIRGERFELGEGLSDAAHDRLDDALGLVEELLADPSPGAWELRSRRDNGN